MLQFQCCDSYQQKIGDSRQVPLDAPPFVWNPALDDFWCACGHSDVPKPPVSQERSAETSEDVSLPPLGHNTQPPPFEVLTPVIDLAQTTFQVDPYSPQSFPKTMHCCMWSNCTSSFSSLPELRDHVVLVHLESSPSTDDSLPNHYITTQAQDSSPSQWPLNVPCLWSNCGDNLYQSHPISASPQSLYRHLMSDHLGVWSPVDTNSSHSSTETAKQNEMPPIQNHCSNFQSIISQDDSSYSSNTPKFQGCSEPFQDCNATTHQCRWKDCSLYFGTCDELTDHITSDHIGSGKAHYDCFWEGCLRNGDQGFQSKQKICRHVQVIASCALWSP